MMSREYVRDRKSNCLLHEAKYIYIEIDTHGDLPSKTCFYDKLPSDAEPYKFNSLGYDGYGYEIDKKIIIEYWYDISIYSPIMSSVSDSVVDNYIYDLIIKINRSNKINKLINSI